MEQRLTDLQLAIMKVLWDQGEASVVDVHETLRRQRRITESTISTLLGRMEERGLVGHREDGRRYLYRAIIDENRVRESLVNDFARRVQGLFADDTPALISRLLSNRDLRPEELTEIREIVDHMQQGLHDREESQ